PKTLFYEYQDLHGVAGHFVESCPQQAQALAQRQPAAAAAPNAPDVDAEATDFASREAILLACLHEVLGDAAAACTAATPLADWPLDPIANGRLAQRLQREFANVAPNDVYRYESAAQWARALQRRVARPQAAPAARAAAPAIVERSAVDLGTP